MNSTRSVRTTSLAVAGVAALAMLLAGCNSDSPDAGADPAPQTSQSASAPASSAPASPSSSSSSSAPSSSAPASSSSSESDDSGAADGKPEKAKVVAGLAKFYETEQNLSKDKAKKFATCMVDQMYKDASPKTLKAMEAGDPTKMDTDDVELLTKSGVKCGPIIQ